MSRPRRTQAERREQTRARVLEHATRLFGEHGYASTSLEQIAAETGTTIRPIYHYFGGKQGLFEAVVDELERPLLEALLDPSLPAGRDGILERFRRCFGLFVRPHFRRVVLVDAPAVLGRERWSTSPIARAAADVLATIPLSTDPVASELMLRMTIGALTEAAVMIAESTTPREVEARIEIVIGLASMVVPEGS